MPADGSPSLHFRVYALDMMPPAALTRADFLKTIKGHVLAAGDLVGTYQKQSAERVRTRAPEPVQASSRGGVGCGNGLAST